MNLPSPVSFIQAMNETPVQEWGPDFEAALGRAVLALASRRSGKQSEPWVTRYPLGVPGEPAPILPGWLVGAHSGLKSAGAGLGSNFDTLSITTLGVDTPAGQRERAQALGIKNFLVGDDVEEGEVVPLKGPEAGSLSTVGLAGVCATAGGLLLLNPVRPHPHLGFSGALFTQGAGIMDRQTKLLMHREVRPSVDTPLCAGCGSCLSVCIFDAIMFTGGRASIDHTLCTGCGECMSACHLAGISPDEAKGVVRFQKQVAEAATAVKEGTEAGRQERIIHANFLTPLHRKAGGGFNRDRFSSRKFGVLLSHDPVALDQATWDHLVEGAMQGLRQWSGFLQEPAPMLERAESLGLGSRQYRLKTIS